MNEQNGKMWIAFHVFYGSDPTALLRDHLLPLADNLQAEGCISEYFYINYWLEGAHVRLRVRPNCKDARSQVVDRVMSQTSEYLSRSPSMHPMINLDNPVHYRSLFEHEYPLSAISEYFDEDGIPRLQPDNSIAVRNYEPEFDRYGGSVGLEIAHDHFSASTHLVRDLIYQHRLDARSIRLGMDALAMILAAVAFFEDPGDVAQFLRSYHSGWTRSFELPTRYCQSDARNWIEHTRRELFQTVLPMCERAKNAAVESDIPEPFGKWVTSCRRTRSLVEKAVRSGRLDFGREPVVADRVREVMFFLARSYIHMTSNRMSVNISDEAYLAYLLAPALAGGFDG